MGFWNPRGLFGRLGYRCKRVRLHRRFGSRRRNPQFESHLWPRRRRTSVGHIALGKERTGSGRQLAASAHPARRSKNGARKHWHHRGTRVSHRGRRNRFAGRYPAFVFPKTDGESTASIPHPRTTLECDDANRIAGKKRDERRVPSLLAQPRNRLRQCLDQLLCHGGSRFRIENQCAASSW